MPYKYTIRLPVTACHSSFTAYHQGFPADVEGLMAQGLRRWPELKVRGSYDHAGSDAPAQELAQVEPGPRRAWRSSSSTFRTSCAAPALTPPPATPSPASTATTSPPASSAAPTSAQLQAYRSAYGGQMNEQLLKQLGVEQQILQQMVDERAALAEAAPPRHHRQRRGSAPADLRRSRRSRRTARSSASSATSSCSACSGRR